MKNLLMVKLLTLLLLCGSLQAARGGQVAWRAELRGEIAPQVTKFFAKLRQNALAALVIAGVSVLPAQAQEVDEAQAELEAAWNEEVTLSGNYYLYLRNPEYEHMHPVVLVSRTIYDEAVFAGLFLQGHDDNYTMLYGADGLITKAFVPHDELVLEATYDGLDELRIFVVRGLNLDETHVPVKPALYPIAEVGRKLQMVQYVPDGNAEGLFDMQPRQRFCEVSEAQGWANAGIGLHTCEPLPVNVAGYVRYGLPLFDATTGELVNFYTGKTETAYSSLGVSQKFINFVLEQQANPTAVSARGKVATTWGEIKKEY